jgi:hypothetical protein
MAGRPRFFVLLFFIHHRLKSIIALALFFRQYLADFGDPVGGSLYAGEAVDRFRLATPNNFHHPGRSGITFSHFENRRLGHPANIRLSVPAMAAKITDRLWEIGDIVGALEAWEAAQVRRSFWEECHGVV